MIEFQASNPFPHISKPFSEAEAKRHAAIVDQWLGLRTKEIESALLAIGSKIKTPNSSKEKQQLWIGLDTQSLLTPYLDLRILLERIQPKAGQTVIDLGAAYGRMGFVIARHFPQVHFIGYEYVGERVKETQRCLNQKVGHEKIKIEHADLSASEFEPKKAEFYFIYDYGTPKAIEKTLYDLKRWSKDQLITIIGRGRNCRYIIETNHAWLRKLNPQEPESRTTIYTSDLELGLGFDFGVEAAM